MVSSVPGFNLSYLNTPVGSEKSESKRTESAVAMVLQIEGSRPYSASSMSSMLTEILPHKSVEKL